MKTVMSIALGAFAVMAISGCGADPKELQAKIQTVLDNPAAQMVLCYQKELAKDRNLRGTVEAKFTVVRGTKGIRDVAVVSSTMNNPVIDQCVVEAVSKIPFPFDPKINVTVIWPFEFAPIN